MNSQGKGVFEDSCAVIIVTHNSQKYLPTCLKALREQTKQPNLIIIVDSGSTDTSYLQAYENLPNVKLHKEHTNVGFCIGNNVGMTYVDSEIKYVLFLNPDAFLSPDFIEKATAKMEKGANHRLGALSGLLVGYDILKNQPTEKIDSTGIFRTWYGRWYDRGQGENVKVNGTSYQPENVPALCGALLFCRLAALRSVELAPNVVMDPLFYMYKEDIDLSLRLRSKGWQLLFCPALEAYHCRGWQQDRKQVPKHLRLQSAKNEMCIYARMKSPCYFYSLVKYLMVKTCNL